MRLLFKKTNGQPSWSLTFAVISFTATTLWLILSIFVKIHGVDIRPFNGADATMYLFPLIGNYFGAKFLAAKNGSLPKEEDKTS